MEASESSPPWTASEEPVGPAGIPAGPGLGAGGQKPGEVLRKKGVKRSIMAAHIHRSLPLPWTGWGGETAQTLGRLLVPSSSLGRGKMPS